MTINERKAWRYIAARYSMAGMSEDLDRKMLHGCLELLVLGALARQARHGYAIRRDLADRSDAYFTPAFGRLYPLLADLERRGLVRGRNEKAGESRVIRVYTLTARGRQELRFRRTKWKKFSVSVNRVLARIR